LPSYLLLEDGVSKLILEDSSGFLLLEIVETAVIAIWYRINRRFARRL